MKILFVCLGNICRSPTAEGAFRKLLADENAGAGVDVDSAGTHAYHVGEPPDPRSQAAALARGIDIGMLRARVVTDSDFASFDYILAMDRSNLDELARRCPAEYRDRLGLFMAYAREIADEAVPDPYYGGASGFEKVLDYVEDASRGLLDALRRRDEQR